MKTDELREKYLAFFESKGHTRRPSDVLVPTWDPSVLFTPAGMNQFKDHFLGKVKLDFTRATTCQKCLRTGDIENVGRTAYHHTFFEMLGNFSFGDYFKRDAINWAWEFLTDKKWLALDPDRLSVTVYLGDDEAANIWADDIHLPPARIERMDEDENFWPANAPSQGPDGICGPCSEIYYHPPGGESVEIWNLVFTQFNRLGDPPDNLRPLPSKNIDTGMGLERTAATLQGVETNYHIDNLRPIVEAAAEVCGVGYEYGSDNGRRLRRVTDHVRACTFAVHENVYPGAQKEKYVIRRLLRRAVLDGHQMGVREPFLHKIVPAVVQAMSGPYPDLCETVTRVADVIRKEEENFFGTVDAGLARIEKIFDTMRSESRITVDGREAAELYQTYGVPAELFETLAAENNLAFDWNSYDEAMLEHGEVSGKVTHTVMGAVGPIDAIKKAMHRVEFLGYESTEAPAVLKYIVAQNHFCDHLTEIGHEREVIAVLDHTPFYGQSGGQVGDTGTITCDEFTFDVTDTLKDGELLLHYGHLTRGEMKPGCQVTATVDADRRQGIRRAHSATHIMHYALQKNLGSHAQQQGSKVDRDWLRFDFTNISPVTAEQLAAVESDVNLRVADAAAVRADIMPLADAREAGAMMLFGDKHPDPVRMISMGEFSRELCGGIHLDNTGEVGVFEIISEEGISAGTRRITALTGDRARQHMLEIRETLELTARVLEVSPFDVPAAVAALAERLRDLKKELAGAGTAPAALEPARSTATADEADYSAVKNAMQDAAHRLNVSVRDVPERATAMKADIAQIETQLSERDQAGPLSVEDLLAGAVDLAGAKVIVAEAPGAAAGVMRQLIDQIRRQVSTSAVLLASRQGDDKVTLVAGVSRDLQDRGANAGAWIRPVAEAVGGGGGGRPDMAQAGGRHPEKLPEALEVARQTIADMLAGK